MDISFQLLLYIMEVKYQEDQYFSGLNFSDVMWKPAIPFFTSPFGLFALIAEPKVEVLTETINSKEKIKLRWSMLNLEINDKNTEHSLPMTKRSIDFPKAALGKLTEDCQKDNLNIKNTKKKIIIIKLSYCFPRCTCIYFFITCYNIDRTLRALWLVKSPCFIRV